MLLWSLILNSVIQVYRILHCISHLHLCLIETVPVLHPAPASEWMVLSDRCSVTRKRTTTSRLNMEPSTHICKSILDLPKLGDVPGRCRHIYNVRTTLSPARPEGHRGVPEPGVVRNLSCMSRVCPGVSSWMSKSKTPPQGDDLVHRIHTPEPLQLGPLNTEEQWLD